MNVPVAKKDRRVRFRRADDFDANTDPVHRQDRRFSRFAKTSASDSGCLG